MTELPADVLMRLGPSPQDLTRLGSSRVLRGNGLVAKTGSPEGIAREAFLFGEAAALLPVGTPTLVALYLIPFSGIAFTWFLAALRRRVGRLEDQLFATVFLATGLLFVAMLFASGAAASAAVTAVRFGSTAAGSIAFLFGASLAKTLFYVFAVKMAGAFMLVSSTIGRRTRAFPRWLILLGFAAGLVMLFSVGFFEPLALIFPAWVAIVSVLLLRADRDEWRDA